mmetsp:Transcript_62840/g.148863  ORF Transcript_62840/g.148863 Transcript_62840/m.148863 type:complete len:117 (-) Transcript_62840:2472-2822(-)
MFCINKISNESIKHIFNRKKIFSLRILYFRIETGVKKMNWFKKKLFVILILFFLKYPPIEKSSSSPCDVKDLRSAGLIILPYFNFFQFFFFHGISFLKNLNLSLNIILEIVFKKKD